MGCFLLKLPFLILPTSFWAFPEKARQSDAAVGFISGQCDAPSSVTGPSRPPTSSSPSSWYCSSAFPSCWSGFPAICQNERGGSGCWTLEMCQACHHEKCTVNASVARKIINNHSQHEARAVCHPVSKCRLSISSNAPKTSQRGKAAISVGYD